MASAGGGWNSQIPGSSPILGPGFTGQSGSISNPSGSSVPNNLLDPTPLKDQKLMKGAPSCQGRCKFDPKYTGAQSNFPSMQTATQDKCTDKNVLGGEIGGAIAGSAGGPEGTLAGGLGGGVTGYLTATPCPTEVTMPPPSADPAYGASPGPDTFYPPNTPGYGDMQPSDYSLGRPSK